MYVFHCFIYIDDKKCQYLWTINLYYMQMVHIDHYWKKRRKLLPFLYFSQRKNSFPWLFQSFIRLITKQLITSHLHFQFKGFTIHNTRNLLSVLTIYSYIVKTVMIFLTFFSRSSDLVLSTKLANKSTLS